MGNKWNRRFLDMAAFVAQWSKDPSTKVGAVIVDPETKNIVGLGYNGFPRGVKDSEERYSDREQKYKYVCHAELNAILNSNKTVRGCDIYIYPTLMEPNCCPECAKAISQSGIKRVFGYKVENLSDRWEELSKFSKTILEESDIEYHSIKEKK